MLQSYRSKATIPLTPRRLPILGLNGQGGSCQARAGFILSPWGEGKGEGAFVFVAAKRKLFFFLPLGDRKGRPYATHRFNKLNPYSTSSTLRFEKIVCKELQEF